MRDLAVLTFVTLDGIMQAPSSPEEDESGKFKHGGWAAPYWEETMQQVQQEALNEPYDMLFGRKTYDIFAGHWPEAEKSELADRKNNSRKYVVTASPDGLNWVNSIAITGDIAAKIRDLKEQDGPLLQVHGSSQLIQLLLANDLIDEFRLWTFPLILGRGKRLFQTGCLPRAFSV